MRCFENGKPGRTIIVRLDQGDDVLDCINQAIKEHKIQDGYIASGIGTLDNALLHMVMTTGYPPVEEYPEWHDQALELVSISGIIADGSPHCHTVISNNKQSWAGHLEPGCRILYLGEIVIQELLGQSLRRIRNPRNILELIEI